MSPHSRDLGKEVEANNLYNQDHKRAGKNHECYLPSYELDSVQKTV